MKKLLALLCSFALICSLGLSTIGCGKKEDKKGTTAAAGTVTGTGTTTK